MIRGDELTYGIMMAWNAWVVEKVGRPNTQGKRENKKDGAQGKTTPAEKRMAIDF